MPTHIIANKYNQLKSTSSQSLLNSNVTDLFKEINDICLSEISRMSQLPINKYHNMYWKNYVVFQLYGWKKGLFSSSKYRFI